MMFGVSAVSARTFNDVNKVDPNFVAIDYLSNNDVLKGYADGNFKPDQLVNRAEALKIIFLSLDMTVDAKADLNNLFPDVKSSDWFATYVAQAKIKGIIGGNADGTFAPGRSVSRAEFVKMLLETVGFKKEMWLNQQLFEDVPKDAWFAPYMNYAGKSGLLSKDKKGDLLPSAQLSRAEVAEIVYLMMLITKSEDSNFLLSQSVAQVAQIENYLGVKDVASADRAAKLAVDMTQQAIKLLPGDSTAMGKAKIAKAYSLLVSAFIAALESRYTDARDLASQTITKATEAWQADQTTQPVAKHLKDKANEVLNQIRGK